MKVNKITYSTIVNTGNFENRRYEVEVLCEDDATSLEAFQYAKECIIEFINEDFKEE